LKFVVQHEDKPETGSRKESTTSGLEARELEGLHDEEFAEALEDIGFDELLANHLLLEDDATSTTSSKDDSLKTSRELSEEPLLKPSEAVNPEELTEALKEQAS